MKCDRCGTEICAGEEMDLHGQVLCEDCAMRALSPTIGCDPWAVRSAQTLSHLDDSYSTLSETQVEILQGKRHIRLRWLDPDVPIHLKPAGFFNLHGQSDISRGLPMI